MLGSSFKLFRLFGIDVFLHWSWLIIAILIVPQMDFFDSILWSAILYISLFVIVTIHEFGHALACRSVGGEANRIVLWPLGGVAYVKPPSRPGAVLWSIAAGPLVNVALVPVTVLIFTMVGGWGLGEDLAGTDFQRYCFFLMMLNFGLLVFNMLPIYPLDGGQVLMSLLWFVVGRVKALKFSSIVGLMAAGCMFVVAMMFGKLLLVAMAIFVGLQAFQGYRMARAMARMDPRYFDERLAKRQSQQSVDERIHAEVDPWR